MNNVLSHIKRQYGLGNRNCNNYDFMLQRLYSHETDNWKGIEPSNYGADFNPEPPIFSAKFCNVKNYRNILAIANEDGKIALQDTNKRNTENPGDLSLEGQQCHYNAVFDLEWMPNHMKFISTSGDHTARLWEITESKFVLNRTFNGHTRSVKTATFRRNDPAVFATGGRDGAILIWDSRASLTMDLMPKADNCIYSGHSGGPGTPISFRRRSRTTPKLPSHTSSSSITGLAFQDDYTLVSCGAGDGIIKIWDLRRNYSSYKKEPQPKCSFPYPGTSTYKGFTNLLIDNYGLRLYVSCMDSNIYCYNLSSYSTSTEPIKKYTGLKNTTFYIKASLSPDGQYLISGSNDEKAYIWNTNYSQPVCALVGHTAEVTCATWSNTNDIRIVTCSDDARHKIWRIGPETIADDNMLGYKGRPEVFPDYRKDAKKLKNLEFTPRSIKRLIEVNEKTPTTMEKPGKRNFDEMTGDDGCNIDGNVIKRPNIESRGRRLFSPVPSTSQSHASTGIKQLATILEDVNHADTSIVTSKIQTMISGRLVSPLSEKLTNSPTSLSSTSWETQSSVYSSPTSNLPNYVLDGEAPHLGLPSPKRKLKENVDWLTKIRKQKMLSSASSIKYLTISSNSGSNNHSSNNNNNENSSNNCEETDYLNDNNNQMLSPRIQSLKSAEYSPRGIPKRRSSRSGSNSDSNSSRTAPSESILKFLTVTPASMKKST